MTNQSPQILVDTTSSRDALNQNIKHALAAGAKALLLLVCESLKVTPDNFDLTLKSLKVPVGGGVFPQLIDGATCTKEGSIVIGLPYDISVCNVDGLSDEKADFRSQMSSFAAATPADTSLLIFADGTCSRLDFFLEECFGLFGTSQQYLGGGAGAFGLIPQPCLFSNDGMTQRSAQIISTNKKMATCVTHGWEKLDGPFLVTSAKRNKIESLDFRPAFEVYHEAIRNQTGQTILKEKFFTFSKNYPIGLSKINDQVVVRDPVNVEGNALVCVGEVPENHVVYILKGNTNTLLAASKSAAQELVKLSAIVPGEPCFLFDCISRLMYMKNRFPEELEQIETIMPEGSRLIGALSIGEISCSGDTCLELFNKSMVMGVVINE